MSLANTHSKAKLSVPMFIRLSVSEMNLADVRFSLYLQVLVSVQDVTLVLYQRKNTHFMFQSVVSDSESPPLSARKIGVSALHVAWL